MFKLGIIDNRPRTNVMQNSQVMRLPSAIKPINYRAPITGDLTYKPAGNFMDRFNPPRRTGNLESAMMERAEEEMRKRSEQSRMYLANILQTKRNVNTAPGETKIMENNVPPQQN
jgi:hypothetical protein